jgi:hypothetical protein
MLDVMIQLQVVNEKRAVLCLHDSSFFHLRVRILTVLFTYAFPLG